MQRLLLAAGAALILTAGSLLVAQVLIHVDGDGEPLGVSDRSTVTGFDLRPERSQATPTAPATPALEPTPTVEPTPEGETPRKLVIPSIGVEAPVVILSVDGNGVMESPNGPEEVGWYDFTSKPGGGSNAVFSGHVDYHDYGKAVFWDLRELEANDIIEVRGDGDSVLRYAVVSSLTYAADEAPVDEIVGGTENDTVTLITCDGTFDSSVRQYDQRRVVTAERVDGPQSAVGQ